MATEKVKKIIIWVIFAFIVYAVMTSPTRSADMVHNAWQIVLDGGHNMRAFFDGILGH